LDGAIEIQGRSGGLGRPADRAVFMAMRAVADAVLVGAGTVRDEDYGPVRMSEEVIARRRTRGQRDIPELAIVSSQAGLRPDAKVFSGAGRPLLLTSEMACARRPDLASQAEMIPCGEIRVELPVALAALADRGLGRLVCEGGPTLFRSLLIADLVDELCLTHAPVLTGSPHRHLTGDAPLGEPLRLTLTGLLEGDGLLLARYAKPEKLFGGGDT
jgi:riboflavin biosynthesis pyrimidine reductase